MTDGTEVVAESVLLPSGGTALGGEPGERRCRRPGCGNLVPVSGRGRTRVFCGDACSRRFHNAARSAGGEPLKPELVIVGRLLTVDPPEAERHLERLRVGI